MVLVPATSMVDASVTTICHVVAPQDCPIPNHHHILTNHIHTLRTSATVACVVASELDVVASASDLD